MSGRIAARPVIEQGAAVPVTIGSASATTATLDFPAGADLSESSPSPWSRASCRAVRAAKPEDPAFADATVDLIDQNPDDTAGRLRILQPGPTRKRGWYLAGCQAATRQPPTCGWSPVPPRSAGCCPGRIPPSRHPGQPRRAGHPRQRSRYGGYAQHGTGHEELGVVAADLQAALAGTTVQVIEDRMLVTPADPAAQITIADAGADDTATVLKLTSASRAAQIRGLLSSTRATRSSRPARRPSDHRHDQPRHGAHFPVHRYLARPPAAERGATRLEAAIRTGTGTPFTQATVQIVGGRLLVILGGTSASTRVTFANADDTTLADALLLTTVATVNLQDTGLGGRLVATTAQLGGAPAGTASRPTAPPSSATWPASAASSRSRTPSCSTCSACRGCRWWASRAD